MTDGTLSLVWGCPLDACLPDEAGGEPVIADSDDWSGVVVRLES